MEKFTKKCFTCRSLKKDDGLLQCSKCRHKHLSLGGFTVLNFNNKHISRLLKRSDLKQNQFVIRDKHGDPLAIGDAPSPLPNKLRNL